MPMLLLMICGSKCTRLSKTVRSYPVGVQCLRQTLQKQCRQENRERIQKEQARQAEQARSLAEQAAVHLARQAELAAACETLAQTVQQIQLEDAQAGAQAESLQQERSAIDARKAKNEQTRFEAELARTAAKTGLSGMDSRKEYLAAELEQAAAQLAEQTAVCKISENKLETCGKNRKRSKTSVPV